MSISRNIVPAFVGMLTIVATVAAAIGLADTSVQAAPATTEPQTVVIPWSVAATLDITRCDDGLPVTIDIDNAVIFGDQDLDGILAGDDCDWR